MLWGLPRYNVAKPEVECSAEETSHFLRRQKLTAAPLDLLRGTRIHVLPASADEVSKRDG